MYTFIYMFICTKNIYMYIYMYIYSYTYIYILKWVGQQRNLCFLEFLYLFCSYIRVCFQLDTFVREHVCQKAYLMGYSMRLELTCVCCLNGFQWVISFYECRSFLFLRVCFSWATLPLIYFWYVNLWARLRVCLCVCVCVCVCIEVV